MKKNILIITYYWPPSGGPGVQRWLKFVKYMQLYNYKPTVLTVEPTSAEYPIIDTSLVEEVADDIKVYRTKSKGLYPLYKKITGSKNAPYSGFVNEPNPNIKQKVARFIRGNFFIPDARKSWNKYAYEAALKIIKTEDIDTVITTGPPMSTHLIGIKLKKKLGIKWIADFRDPWTDIYYYNSNYPTKIAKDIDKKLEKKVLINADSIITVSEEISRLLKEKSDKINEENIFVLPNGYDEEDFKENIKKERKFTITYVGTLSSSYTIDAFIAALSEILLDYGNAVRLRFVGKVSDDMKEKIKNLVCELEFIPFVPHQEAIRYMKKSSLLLLIIPNTKGNEGNLTGKLFEYIGSTTPILAIAPTRGDAAHVIEYTGTGFVADYDDQEKMYNVIKQYFSNNTRNIVERRNIIMYSRKMLTFALTKILDRE